MKCAQTMSGVLAIVGLGYLAGVGQSLLRDKPIILGSGATARVSESPNPVVDPKDTQTDPAQDPNVLTPTDESHELEIPDLPVPDGMLTMRQAHAMWVEGAYFIDARHLHEYELGHISGAAHLNAETFFSDAGIAEMQTIPPDAPVVIYCVGGLCDASENVLALLEQSGYSNLSIMGVGYEDWENAKLPTSLSDGTGSGESP